MSERITNITKNKFVRLSAGIMLASSGLVGGAKFVGGLDNSYGGTKLDAHLLMLDHKQPIPADAIIEDIRERITATNDNDEELLFINAVFSDESSIQTDRSFGDNLIFIITNKSNTFYVDAARAKEYLRLKNNSEIVFLHATINRARDIKSQEDFSDVSNRLPIALDPETQQLICNFGFTIEIEKNTNKNYLIRYNSWSGCDALGASMLGGWTNNDSAVSKDPNSNDVFGMDPSGNQLSEIDAKKVLTAIEEVTK